MKINLLLIFFGLLLLGCSKKSDDPAAPTLGSGSFIVAGRTYTGTCTGGTSGTGSGGIDVGIIPANGNTFLGIYNMPTASSGTFTFQDARPQQGLHIILSLDANINYTRAGGTLTKTGPKSFTFSCTMYDLVTSLQSTMTGQGSY